MLLGCIADDITGASDLALTLARNGMRVVQYFGVPQNEIGHPADAIVVALKSRTMPAEDAVALSLRSVQWLQNQGARQYFFKYCSTFDSTPTGNIGPVAEALMDHLDTAFTLACPAFPATGRTVYQGHLFVGGQLLSQSSMRDHPLTPMTESDLVKVLSAQAPSTRIGLVPLNVVENGPEAVISRCRELQKEGVRMAIADALFDRHLLTLGQACQNLTLVTGGSGMAMGLPENFRARGQLADTAAPVTVPTLPGPVLIVAGSCSAATREQVEMFTARHRAVPVDPLELASGAVTPESLFETVRPLFDQGPVLVYSSAAPENVADVQTALGRDKAGALVEEALSSLARRCADAGISKFIIAGGETSGAVAAALDIEKILIGPEIDPGVPWTVHLGQPPLLLAFKSGNFGTPNFFEKAVRLVE